MFLSFGFSKFLAMSKVQTENFHLGLKKNSAKICALESMRVFLEIQHEYRPKNREQV